VVALEHGHVPVPPAVAVLVGVPEEPPELVHPVLESATPSSWLKKVAASSSFKSR
jgi:hypothetical protein